MMKTRIIHIVYNPLKPTFNKKQKEQKEQKEQNIENKLFLLTF